MNGETFGIDKDGFVHIKNKMEYQQNEWTFVWRAKSAEESETKDSNSAHTLIKMISYNTVTDQSLMLCVPITGRTHQIREHLRFVGYPIVNDVGFELTNEKAEKWENPWPEKWETMKQFENDDKKCAEKLLQYQWERHQRETQKEGEYLVHLHAFFYSFFAERTLEFKTDLPQWSHCHVGLEGHDAFYTNLIETCRKVNPKSSLSTATN